MWRSDAWWHTQQSQLGKLSITPTGTARMINTIAGMTSTGGAPAIRPTFNKPSAMGLRPATGDGPSAGSARAFNPVGRSHCATATAGCRRQPAPGPGLGPRTCSATTAATASRRPAPTTAARAAGGISAGAREEPAQCATVGAAKYRAATGAAESLGRAAARPGAGDGEGTGCPARGSAEDRRDPASESAADGPTAGCRACRSAESRREPATESAADGTTAGGRACRSAEEPPRASA